VARTDGELICSSRNRIYAAEVDVSKDPAPVILS